VYKAKGGSVRQVLWTPILYDTCKERLFRIISNIRADTINCSPEMAIGTANRLRFSHSGFKRLEHFCKGGMHELTAEFPKAGIPTIFFIR